MNWIMKLTKALPEKWVMSASAEFTSFVTLVRVRSRAYLETKAYVLTEV